LNHTLENFQKKYYNCKAMVKPFYIKFLIY